MPERGGVEHQRGGVGRRDAVIEPVDPEVGDGGHIEQDGGDHHQGDGEQQQLAGQAEPAGPTRPHRRLARLIRIMDRLEVCRCHEVRPYWLCNRAWLMEDATRPGAGQITDR
ncbi:hypothetical protein ABIF64_000462 [Bradyrhizobium japonicum]